MTNGKTMITGVLGLMLFLAASNAQEPPRKVEKASAPQSAATKRDAPSRDMKSREDTKGAAAAALLESAYEGDHPPEAVRMLAAVLRGSRMGAGDGWFGPAENRYSWKWLAGRCGVDPAARSGIPRNRFRGSDAWFARLDRDKDGAITPDDFDWSDRSPYVQMARMVDRLFGKLNEERDGRLTKEELVQFFDKAAQGKNYVTPDDFRDTLLGGLFSQSGSSDMPSQAVLIRGLFSGELGSMNEGPKLNAPAPDFTLKTSDGKETIQLTKRIGPKPIALVFGSFT